MVWDRRILDQLNQSNLKSAIFSKMAMGPKASVQSTFMELYVLFKTVGVQRLFFLLTTRLSHHKSALYEVASFTWELVL